MFGIIGCKLTKNEDEIRHNITLEEIQFCLSS